MFNFSQKINLKIFFNLRKSCAVIVLGLLALVLCNCGASSNKTSATNNHLMPNQSTSNGTSKSSPASSSGSLINEFDGLKLSSLSSLQNYTFEVNINQRSSAGQSILEVTGTVYSPTDWAASGFKITSDIPQHFVYYDVDGVGYSVINSSIGHITFATPEGINHLYGESYFAQKLLYDLQNLGLKLTKNRGCAVAGIQGQDYNLGNSVSDSTSTQRGNICIASNSGALISYFLNLPSGSTNSLEQDSFSVTAVNNVSPIVAP
jgi:hypothetical protein